MKSVTIEGRKIYYRDNRTDRNVIREVIELHGYRRKKFGFDVMAGEHWLDLGANIGAFAVYCGMRGAHVTCYEPEPENCALAKKNAPFALVYQRAVTANLRGSTRLFGSPLKGSDSRFTTIRTGRYKETGKVLNTFAGALMNQRFDGIKMDIEGAEGPILDDWLLPPCKKLVLEYHTSRDSSVDNLSYRLDQIEKHFKCISYPKEFDTAIASSAKNYKSFNDRLIFAWEPR